MSADLASRLCHRLSWDDLDHGCVRHFIQQARAEDMEGHGLRRPPALKGDLSTQLLPGKDGHGSALLVARQQMVVCGLPLLPFILEAYGNDAAATPHVTEGSNCPQGTVIAGLHGRVASLLAAERVVLNCLQLLSGIATTTRKHVDALGNDSPTRLLDTRKTIPGMRLLCKVATATGGGVNHRLGLYDRIMLKDNHLAASSAAHGSALTELVRHARSQFPNTFIELEIDALEQIEPALAADVDVLLLDNFTDDQLAIAVAQAGGKVATEASGGIHIDRLPALGKLGLDFVSTGATIHHAAWADIGMDWQQ
jgi:nicotinate-nucleotide pyrophosphorylase (carboxylating)